MSGTAIHCAKCEGRGVLLINISADGTGSSFIEQPCDACDGTGKVSRASLMTKQAEYTLEPDSFMPLAMTGAFRAAINGEIYERKMSARDLYKLASYALIAAMETDKFEKENDNGDSGQL
jgi:hypothetical protein